jgi:hypothetical protein
LNCAIILFLEKTEKSTFLMKKNIFLKKNLVFAIKDDQLVSDKAVKGAPLGSTAPAFSLVYV